MADIARVLSEHAGLFPDDPSVFFAFSFLPHACLPNAALLRDEGPEVTLVAVLDVPAGSVLTVDRLHWPRVYSPAWVRTEHLGEMGCTCTCPLCTGDHPEVVRAFVCPKCDAPELVPLAPSHSSELGRLRCRSCGHDATEDEQAACSAAEEDFDQEPTLLTAPRGQLSHLHWLNVQLAWSYLFELAPLDEPTLHEQHRAVVEVLVEAVLRLHPTASPRTLRELYQVASELYDTTGGASLELAAQERSLRRLAALQEAFFPRAAASDVQLTRKMLGPEYARVLNEET